MQLDSPRDGERFRVMAQNFNNKPAKPRLFVYCSGERAGSFDAPALPPNFQGPSERGFGLFVGEPYATMVSAITGWDVSVEELERVGERIINLERLFNVREGVRRSQDVLPWKVMHEPIPEGPSAGMYCPPEELDVMLDAYYALRGWNRDGVPTSERLASLGL